MPRRPIVAIVAVAGLVAGLGWAPGAFGRGVDAIISVSSARSLTTDGTADLTGDGRGDIVEKTIDGTTTTFGVRSGLDGKLVWAHNTRRSLAAIRAGRWSLRRCCPSTRRTPDRTSFG